MNENRTSKILHEIKGALTVVKGSIDLLLMNDSSSLQERKEVLTIAKNNTAKVIQLLNELVAEYRKEEK